MAAPAPEVTTLDAVVVGAGFGGVYALHRLRSLGLTVRAFEAGSGVGGTWFWNRYPGARCDVESLDYSYSFDSDLQQEWTWTERFAPQGEILAYINEVVRRFDLARDITLNTRVASATFDEATGRWTVTTEHGAVFDTQWVVFATGCLSVPYTPDLPGLESFGGEVFHTGRWPHHEVDLTGKRVGVMGTGSSGIQVISAIAPLVSDLFVFQRTPHYSIPAQNRMIDETTAAELKAHYDERRVASRNSRRGYPAPPEVADMSALDDSPETRAWRFESLWRYGGPLFTSSYNDLMRNADSNRTAADFVRAKIDAQVQDAAVAAHLKPMDYPIGGKRICVDTGYYATYNRENVHLLDVRDDPVVEITERGVRTASGETELDVLILATGYDAMTGALRRIDIRGRDGLGLNTKWADGPRTYLGLMISGFPNFFLVTGPGSPSVLCNMVLACEQHVDWIARCITDARSAGQAVVEATADAEAEWVGHVNEVADRTLYPSVNSWRSGTNIPGKPRVFMPYVGGFSTYAARCDQEAEAGYPGLTLGAGA